MILASQEVKQLSESPVPLLDRLIHPFNDEHLRGSSYDLTVGGEYYIGPDLASSKLETEQLAERQSFTIPPHAVCFILAAEKIVLPKDITAKVSLRMAYIYAGMVLTSQPPFDPGYKGRVIVMLHNLSSEPFYLRRGERLVTIEFTKLTAPTTLGNNKVHSTVETLQAQLPKPLVSSLSDIAKTATAANEKVNAFAVQMITVVALMVAVLAVPGLASYSSLTERLNEQKTQVDKMKEDLEKSENTIKELSQQVKALKPKPAGSVARRPPHDIIVNIENGNR